MPNPHRYGINLSIGKAANYLRILLVILAATTHLSAQRIIKFDAPGGGSGKFQGTQPAAINAGGTITGGLTDSGNGTHGFLRKPDGTFEANFDAPGADPVVGCTCPASLNDAGMVAGYSIDSSSVYHGFLRSTSGSIVVFDIAGAGTAGGQGTIPNYMNDLGTIAGYTVDTNNVSHGFLRFIDGRVVQFDIPGAGTEGYEGTYVEGINKFGVVSGLVVDQNDFFHGFVRRPDGSYTIFDPPAAVGGRVGTTGALINDWGVVSGNFIGAKSSVYVGYLHYPDGSITTFQPPEAGEKPYYGTYLVSAANLKGTTTGFYQDKELVAHSFVRYAGQESITFEIPGQITVPGTTYGSAGVGINDSGIVAGRWHDPNYAVHGFIRLPH